MNMIYVYQKTDNIYIVTEKKLNGNGTIPILTLMWDGFSFNNIRPWKHLNNTRHNYYKPEVLNYFKLHEQDESTPQEESLEFVYRDQVEVIFEKYIKVLELFRSLDLIKEIPSIKYSHNIIYSCDVKNYLNDVLGNKQLALCDDFLNIEEYKKIIIQELSKQYSEEDKIKYLENKNVDNDIYQFLPPWLKVSYQVFGEGHKTIKRRKIPEIEYNENDHI